MSLQKTHRYEIYDLGAKWKPHALILSSIQRK